METNKSALLAAYEKVTRGVKSCALLLPCSQCPFHNYNGMSCRDGLLKETNQFFDNIKEHISKLFDPENSDRNTDEREELITALRCITSEHPALCVECRAKKCKYAGTDCVLVIPEDAAKYLESLEPRLLSLEEVKAFVDPYISNRPKYSIDDFHLWIEHYGRKDMFLAMPCFSPYDDNKAIMIDRGFAERTVQTEEYNKTWRCWTALSHQPTAEKRKAAPWDE